MTGCAIVAIPPDGEPVWRVSSEKIPHMTILFLGELSDEEIVQVYQYLEHAAKMTRPYRFGMSVKHRGTLGDEEADVLFFEKNKSWEDFRGYLLKDATIFAAYSRTQQYPEWTPHLTMGYPKTPAKPDKREYQYWGYIDFDRLALWTGEYEGPTFRIEYPTSVEVAEEVSMSDPVDDHLAHFGIKGMRWGIRKDKANVESQQDLVVVSSPGRKAVAVGGARQLPSDDAKRAAAYKQKARASTTDSLTTKELQELVNRLNLEAQYSKLTPQQMSPGEKFAKDLFGKVAKKQLEDIANEQASRYVGKFLVNAGLREAKKAASR